MLSPIPWAQHHTLAVRNSCWTSCFGSAKFDNFATWQNLSGGVSARHGNLSSGSVSARQKVTRTFLVFCCAHCILALAINSCPIINRTAVAPLRIYVYAAKPHATVAAQLRHRLLAPTCAGGSGSGGALLKRETNGYGMAIVMMRICPVP